MADFDARPALSKGDAIRAIVRYLRKEWFSLTEDQVTVEILTGGYVNTVHLVTRSTESILEPQEVVIHQSNGGFQVERGKGTLYASRMEELLVFNESSNLGTGPKLYGASEELSVQEYFKGHTLTPEDCLDPNILTKLAQAYAKFHTMDPPIDRGKFEENIPLFRQKYKQFADSKERVKELVSQMFPDVNWDEIFDFDIEFEFNWILKLIDQTGNRRVVNTGDQNYLNVLVANDGSRVTLVDYEMAKFEPRGLDLGGHFINRTIKWNDKKNKASGHEILDRKLRSRFITAYCFELARHADKITDFDPIGLDGVDHVMEETDIGILVYPLIWGSRVLFELEQVIRVENGSFCTAAVHLIKLYIKLKDQMLHQHPHWQSTDL